MAVSTAAGTLIGIASTVPATFDVAGYAALTFSTIGEITDPGEHGRTYTEVTHSPIGTRGVQKFKGSFNEGNKTMQLAIDPEDAGQILAKTALNSDDDFSFSVEYPDGSTDYFQAKVMGFAKATGSVDSIISGTLTLAITTSKDGDGIIEAPAAP